MFLKYQVWLPSSPPGGGRSSSSVCAGFFFPHLTKMTFIFFFHLAVTRLFSILWWCVDRNRLSPAVCFLELREQRDREAERRSWFIKNLVCSDLLRGRHEIPVLRWWILPFSFCLLSLILFSSTSSAILTWGHVFQAFHPVCFFLLIYRVIIKVKPLPAAFCRL